MWGLAQAVWVEWLAFISALAQFRVTLLLLDDVFSELDAHRCRQLMEVLPQDMQIFISSAQPIEQEMLAGKVADVFEVTDGTIQRRVLDE